VVLVDTSAWIEVFRRPQGLKLESVVEFDDLVTCLPVVQEVLQGLTTEESFRTAREAMLALPMVESPLGESVVIEGWICIDARVAPA
jgi:predicted nucleic acid-binding protein